MKKLTASQIAYPASAEVEYSHGFSSDNSDYEFSIYRNGELVGELGYNDMMDMSFYWYDAPTGERVVENYADENMSPADLMGIISGAYGDAHDADTTQTRYSVQMAVEGRCHDIMWEDEYMTLDEARERFAEVDVKGDWIREDRCRSFGHPNDYSKSIVENVYVWDDGEWELSHEGATIEFESYGYDDFAASEARIWLAPC